jgi:hypothetical protein
VAGSGGTILKKGFGGEPYLTVLPPCRVVGSDSGSANFFVTSNTSWHVISDSSWCTVTHSGSGNDTIFVSYSANTSTKPRVDTIRAYSLQQPIILKKGTVTQSGVNGIENISNNTFRIYPNPATDKITIKYTRNLYKDNTVIIYTITGEFVKQYQIRNKNQVEIDVSNMVKGMYLVKVQTASGIEVQKLVVQ